MARHDAMNMLMGSFGRFRRALVVAVTALALLGAGGIGGWMLHKHARQEEEPQRRLPLRMGGYRYINPLLECDSARGALENEIFLSFRRRIDALIGQWKEHSSVQHVSVYFRELNNGLSFGIDEQEKFFPASLIKIPLLIAYLKAAEQDPLLLTKRLTYSGSRDMTDIQFFKPAVTLEPGRSYSVEELLRAMIVSSDNNAYYLLFANLSPKMQRAVFTDLGLQVPKVRNLDDYVTVGEYAAFFRILFNASYLSHEYSERALELLVEAEFTQGLKAGLPQGLPVADKFGEWAPGGNDDIKQLHDCGIIYYPGQPYLLCVMSRGASYEDLAGVIGDVSRLTFSEVNRRYHAF